MLSAGHTMFDASSMAAPDLYKLLVGVVVPRPIAFVSTQSAAGVGNLAPYSFFNAISSNPPCVVISVARKADGSKKDTLRNIEEIGEFVVNISSSWLLDAVVQCGAQYPYGVDEMQQVGLTPEPSVKVRPPRVRESAAQLECVLHQVVEVGDGSPGSTSLVVGRVVALHIATNAIRDGRIDSMALEPLARLGGISYLSAGQEIKRKIPEV